tara:strand:+ start:1215 stop:1370 length:156 start_codon:yes stop_codon:yes gene_type:complete
MSHHLSDFVHNKYVNIIPISAEAFDDDMIANSSQANLHIELNDSVRGGAVA